jgi:hypothetical protein
LFVSNREKYKWKPTHCDLLEWNAAHFCELLGNQTMLLVGDSLMEQSANTLFAMIKEGTFHFQTNSSFFFHSCFSDLHLKAMEVAPIKSHMLRHISSSSPHTVSNPGDIIMKRSDPASQSSVRALILKTMVSVALFIIVLYLCDVFVSICAFNVDFCGEVICPFCGVSDLSATCLVCSLCCCF